MKRIAFVISIYLGIATAPIFPQSEAAGGLPARLDALHVLIANGSHPAEIDDAFAAMEAALSQSPAGAPVDALRARLATLRLLDELIVRRESVEAEAFDFRLDTVRNESERFALLRSQTNDPELLSTGRANARLSALLAYLSSLDLIRARDLSGAERELREILSFRDLFSVRFDGSIQGALTFISDVRGIGSIDGNDFRRRFAAAFGPALAERSLGALTAAGDERVLLVLTDPPGAAVNVNGTDEGASPVCLRDALSDSVSVNAAAGGRSVDAVVRLRAGLNVAFLDFPDEVAAADPGTAPAGTGWQIGGAAARSDLRIVSSVAAGFGIDLSAGGRDFPGFNMSLLLHFIPVGRFSFGAGASIGISSNSRAPLPLPFIDAIYSSPDSIVGHQIAISYFPWNVFTHGGTNPLPNIVGLEYNLLIGRFVVSIQGFFLLPPNTPYLMLFFGLGMNY